MLREVLRLIRIRRHASLGCSPSLARSQHARCAEKARGGRGRKSVRFRRARRGGGGCHALRWLAACAAAVAPAAAVARAAIALCLPACLGAALECAAPVSIRQHTSAYVSIRQHASACVSIRQNTSAYVSIREAWEGEKHVCSPARD
jgi:hypothetical protein